MIKKWFKKWCFVLGTLSVLLSAGGCLFFQNPPGNLPQKSFVKLSEKAFPDFKDSLVSPDLVRALEQSIVYYGKIPGDRNFKVGDETYSANHMKRSLVFFLEFIRKHPSSDAVVRFVRNHYDVFQSLGRDQRGEVLFTGY